MVETESRPDPSAAPVLRRPHSVMEQSTSPINQSALRVSNAWRVLRCVRESGPVSRARIAVETGLTQTTVHRIIDDLAERRLLASVGAAVRGNVGRPSTLFRFNAGSGHVIGIDVGNETTRAAVADLDGGLLGETHRTTASIEADLIGGIERLASDVQAAASVRSDALVGIGIGVAGVTEAGGTIVKPSVHRLWQGLQLGQLRRYLGCDVIVAQDDHLAALAELRHGACVGIRNAVILNMGKGVGAGVIADGEVHYGAWSASGRVAWIPLCDGQGTESPLGELITTDGLIADYRRNGGTAPASGAIDVFTADRTGDPAAGRAIDLLASRIGWLISAIIAILDPQIVVLGGGMSGSFERLAPVVHARVAAIIADPPPIVASQLGTHAVVHGAIDAALGIADGWLLARVGG